MTRDHIAYTWREHDNCARRSLDPSETRRDLVSEDLVRRGIDGPDPEQGMKRIHKGAKLRRSALSIELAYQDENVGFGFDGSLNQRFERVIL